MKKSRYEEQAVIIAPGRDDFREFVLFVQNGIRLLDKEGNLVKTAQSGTEPVEAEDTGEKGYSYRSERFANRLAKDMRISKIFSSKIHGDPATPLLKAYAGERVILRTVMPADKPRHTGFTLHAHTWPEQPENPYSRIVPMQGAISIGSTYDMEPICGIAAPAITFTAPAP